MVVEEEEGREEKAELVGMSLDELARAGAQRMLGGRSGTTSFTIEYGSLQGYLAAE